MVRMAFSPRLIWGTPWSQPIHQAVSDTRSKYASASASVRCLLLQLASSSYPVQSSHTGDQTANTDGSSEGSTAGVEGAVEPIISRMLVIKVVLELLLVVGVVLTSCP